MNRSCRAWIIAVALVAPAWHSAALSNDDDVFQTVIAPAVSAKCVACHRPDNLKGGLDLTTLDGWLRGGDSGAAVVAGNPDESPAYFRSTTTNGSRPEMPEKGDPFSADESAALRSWIADGTAWPENTVLREPAKADASFWSFQPLSSTRPPEVSDAPDGWNVNPIDRFVLAQMRQQNLSPNPPADARTLIRRATFDLTGLPPTPNDVAAFVTECEKGVSDVAVAKLIDRLLDSPQYGERWGRHWLDVIRFGESRGYERNEIITNLWPFRDYVIRSINEDKPFDQFIREHLAGDVMGRDQPDIEIGSAFLVAGPYDDVGNQDAVAAAQIRADQMDEMIRATSEAFLGLTLGCARCHDHKFDPLPTRDYYAMYATFAGTRHGPREVASAAARAERESQLKPLQDERARLVAEQLAHASAIAGRESTDDENARTESLKAAIAKADADIAAVPALPVWWVGTHSEAPGPQAVYIGGSSQRKGEGVWPTSLSVLSELSSAYELDASSSEADRRQSLAKWLTSADNPLTPRVLANRIWQYHFGTGIVDTPSDFGFMGSRPTHPALLDWLAQELVRNNWQLKPLHRLIMTSQTYRQSGTFRHEAAAVDADSRLLWRFHPRRLSAEEIRDAMLQFSGQLDLKMGGPGFRLYEYQQDNVATYVPLNVHGSDTYRRAIYHHNARAARVDVLTDFDCPDPAFAEPRRASTTTPLQALTLMNHSFSQDMTRLLADRLLREALSPIDQTRLAFELAYSREPTEPELSAAVRLIESHGLRAFCRAVLNSNELIHVN